MLDHQVLTEDRQNADPRDYFTTIETLMAERADTEAQRQVHLERVELETRRIEAYDLVLASLRRRVASESRCAVTLSEIPPRHEREIPVECETSDILTETACGGATTADIMDCKTQPECLYVIARKNGGFLDVNAAADLIIAAGKSRGMRSTVISTTHNYMSERADWQKIAPSKFRLIECEESPVITDPETVIQGV